MVKGLKESVDSDTVRTIPCDAAFTLPILVYRLREVFSLGYWIYIPAFFFGLGGSCMTAYKVYLSVCKKEEEEKKSKDKAFNEHKS